MSTWKLNNQNTRLLIMVWTLKLTQTLTHFYQTLNSVLNQEMHQIQQNVFKGLCAKIFNVRVTLIFNSKIVSRVYLGILLHNLKFRVDITYPNSLEGKVNIIHQTSIFNDHHRQQNLVELNKCNPHIHPKKNWHL